MFQQVRVFLGKPITCEAPVALSVFNYKRLIMSSFNKGSDKSEKFTKAYVCFAEKHKQTSNNDTKSKWWPNPTAWTWLRSKSHKISHNEQVRRTRRHVWASIWS